MFGRLRTRPARWIAAAAATMTLAGVALAAVASPAYAEQFPFSDDFEGTPASRWEAQTIPNQTSVVLGTVAGAHSGTKAAKLDAGAIPVSTIARIYRTVTPDPPNPPAPQRCTVSVYVKRVAQQNPVYSSPDAIVYGKVRLGNSFGKPLLASSKTITGTAWQKWDVGSMFRTTDTITLDLHIYFGIVVLDDFAITCRNLV